MDNYGTSLNCCPEQKTLEKELLTFTGMIHFCGFCLDHDSKGACIYDVRKMFRFAQPQKSPLPQGSLCSPRDQIQFSDIFQIIKLNLLNVPCQLFCQLLCCGSTITHQCLFLSTMQRSRYTPTPLPPLFILFWIRQGLSEKGSVALFIGLEVDRC